MNSSLSSSTVFCFASMPELYRKKCKACQHVNSKECKRCGGAEGAGTTASEGYEVSVVHVTCSYGYEYGNSQVPGYRCKLRSGGP